MKKIISGALIVLLLLALSACGSNKKDWYFEESTNTLYVNSNNVMVAFEPNIPNEGTTSNAPWAQYLPEIENIVVGDSVTMISDYAFAFCSSLKDVIIGENVASLGRRCFYMCGDWQQSSDLSITINCAAFPYIGEDVFGWTWDNPNATVYVPSDTALRWEEALQNHAFKVVSLQQSSSETSSIATSESVVIFTDTVLEELVRKALNKPNGDILLAEAEAVTELNLEMEGGIPIPRIQDISDLKYFPNLTYLNLNWALYNGGEDIDISPLANLTKLEGLFICCNDISDITPLKNLVNLKALWIWGTNRISDISPLSGMTKMEDLWIKGNQISDIGALANMTELTTLFMEENQITDISPITGLSKLKRLRLNGNPITDYSPLTDIYKNIEEKDFELE